MHTKTRWVVLGLILLAAALWLLLGEDRGGRADERDDAERRGATAGGGDLAAQLAAPKRLDLDLRRLDRATIAGHVRDPAGRPIAGATVCAGTRWHELSAADQREKHCVTSEADGGYRIEGLFPVRHFVHASAPTFIPQQYNPREDRWSGNVTLRAGQETRDIDIVLLPGGVEIKGVVRDLSGGELEGAHVSAGFAHARSGPEGTFSLWVRPGDLWVSAEAEGYAPGQADGVAPGHFFEVFLTPEAVLVGRVVRADDGTPVEGAHVSAQVSTGWGWGGPAITDASGNFRIDGLQPGAYKAEAEHDTAYGKADELVVLGLGETSAPVEIRAHPAFSVDGVIVVAGADVCDDGWIRLDDKPRDARYVSVSPDGTAHLRGLMPGTYEVSLGCRGMVSEPAYAPVEIVDKSVAGLRWEVQAGQAIRGEVVLAGGKPAPRVSVSAEGIPDPAAPRAQLTSAYGNETDEQGRFELVGLLPGRYRLSVWGDDVPSLPKPIEAEVPEGQDLEDFTIALPAAGEVRGRVRDVDGRPVASADISLRNGSDGASGSAADDGSFHIKGIVPGEYRVTARKNSTSMRTPGTSDDDLQGATVEVEAGEVATIDLVVEAQGATISGRVIDSDGGPLADAYIEAKREPDSAAATAGSALRQSRWGSFWNDKPTLTDQDGRFTLDGLTEGKYTLLAHRRGGGEGSAEHVAPGSSVEIKIAATGSLSGAVKIVGGGAPQEFSVRVSDKKTGYQAHDSFFRTGGAFSIPEVPKGDFEVVVESPEGAGEAQVALGEGETRQVEVALQPRITVRGRVLDLETGEPVPGMRVSFGTQGGGLSFGPDSGAQKGEVTDAEGRFEVPKVPAGPAQAAVMPRSWSDTEYGWSWFPLTIQASGAAAIEVPAFKIPRKRVKDDEAAGDLGIKLKENEPTLEPEQRRAVVAFVRPGGAGAQAGLKPGDEIVAVDGHDVTGVNLYRFSALTRVKAGTKVTLTVAGGGTLVLTATKMP